MQRRVGDCSPKDRCALQAVGTTQEKQDNVSFASWHKGGGGIGLSNQDSRLRLMIWPKEATSSPYPVTSSVTQPQRHQPWIQIPPTYYCVCDLVKILSTPEYCFPHPKWELMAPVLQRYCENGTQCGDPSLSRLRHLNSGTKGFTWWGYWYCLESTQPRAWHRHTDAALLHVASCPHMWSWVSSASDQ